MEYFDVVDKNRISLNYKKVREETLNNNEYNTGVEIWIINDNKILMTQRSKLKSHPGQWEVPGGCCQAGEDIITTVIRELNEEIGIKINKDDFCLIGTQLYKKQFVDIFKTEVKINIENIKLQDEEVKNVKFINKNEFMIMRKNDKIVPSVLKRYDMINDKLNLNW